MKINPARRKALKVIAGAVPGLALPPAPAQQTPVATSMVRWRVPEASQGVAVDATHFYGIGNRVLVKHRKDNGQRVAAWRSPESGRIVHLNSGYVDGGRLVLAHSNYPHQPPVSSIEYHDAQTLQPVESRALGARAGSLTWAVRRAQSWWACFASYGASGSQAGSGRESTYLGQFDEGWRMLRSWRFPRRFIASWGSGSCSGGDWGDDGLLYATGHDAPELHVMRLPAQGDVLDHVATIAVPFEGQGWAWDRSARGERVIYGISRARREVIAARIPEVPAAMRAR